MEHQHHHHRYHHHHHSENHFAFASISGASTNSSNNSQAGISASSSSNEAASPCQNIGANGEKLPTAACVVCDVETAESSCGITVCSACKKFFLRNQDQLHLFNCITGRNDCDVSRVTKAGESLWPRKLKLICRRCRLVKAFAMGLSVKGARRFRSFNGGVLLSSSNCDGQQQNNASPPSSPSNNTTAANNSNNNNNNNNNEETVELRALLASSQRLQSQSSGSSFLSSSEQTAPQLPSPLSTAGVYFTPKLVDEINVAAEAYVACATVALRELLEKLGTLPTVAIQPTATESSLWNLLAMDFEVTGKFFVEYARKLPGLAISTNTAADLAVLQHAYAGLKAVSVSLPFKRRSFVSCFERCQAFGTTNLPDIEILDECVRLIESTIEMWQPTTQELAILMAIHAYQALQEYSTNNNNTNNGPESVSNQQTPVMLLYVALGTILSKSSRSSERLSMFKHVLSMLKIMSGRWNVTLSRLAQSTSLDFNAIAQAVATTLDPALIANVSSTVITNNYQQQQQQQQVA